MNTGTGRAQTRPRRFSHTRKLKRIRLFATDVDGVLTDGGLYYSNSGEQAKKFHAWDGLGLTLLRKAGLVTALVTLDQTHLLPVRAAKLGIAEVHQGVSDKLGVLKALSVKYGIGFEEIAYMGDDLNDVPALRAVGFSATPANGRAPARDAVQYVCTAKGGEGAVREVADLILAAQGFHPDTVQSGP